MNAEIPEDATITTAGRWAVATGSATHPSGTTPDEDDKEDIE